MNFLQHPGAISSQNLQIWNNAAFDSAPGVSDALSAKVSWCPLNPISTNRIESLDADSGKENRSPGFPKSPICKKPQPPIKPLRPKPTKASANQKEEADFDDGRIDAEIEEIEIEIRRLSSRLEALRIKKRESRAAADGRRGRIVPAKFMDPKKDSEVPDSRKVKESPVSVKLRQKSQNLDLPILRRIEESPTSTKILRRGASLGPMEIRSILKSKKLESADSNSSTPLRSVQSRRKSCFWKLEGIEEEEGAMKQRDRRLFPTPRSRPSIVKPLTKKVAESPANSRFRLRGISLGPSEITTTTTKFRKPKDHPSSSVSPKSRSLAKGSDFRNGIATVGAKKTSIQESRSSIGLKPKVLFQDTDSVGAERPAKSMKARVVASRYSLAFEPGNKRRKWSLPEIEKEEMDRTEGKCSLSLGGTPSSRSVSEIAESLPKIRTIRCTFESPRDSGPAKRVAELVGRKRYFEEDDEAEACQTLTFEEGEEQ